MKRHSSRSKSSNTSKKVKYKLDFKDDSIMKVKWKSPNDGKENVLDIGIDLKDNSFIKIKDNH